MSSSKSSELKFVIKSFIMQQFLLFAVYTSHLY